MDPLNLESQNRAKNIPVALPCFQIKILGKSIKGLLSYDRTNKPTDKQRLQLYVDIQGYPQATKFNIIISLEGVNSFSILFRFV